MTSIILSSLSYEYFEKSELKPIYIFYLSNIYNIFLITIDGSL